MPGSPRTDAAAVADAAAARGHLELLLASEPGLAALLPAGYLDAVERFVALLLETSLGLNLTRVVEPEAVARLHLLDALAALPLLQAWAPDVIVDLGSGGGVPAIPLALALPDTAWTLVDSVGKKAAALRAFADELGLTRVTVLTERAEVLGHDHRHRGRYALVTARAVAPLPVLAELALPLLRAGGRLLAWKGPLTAGDEELRRGRIALAAVGAGPPEVVSPPVGAAALGGHRFVVAVKVRPTPRRFPRRPGEPGRRPLG